MPYIKIFTVEAICMIIELCSSYLSYPYFGNGHSVWVAIIAVVLLSNSIGNIIGGRLSNKTKETGKDYTGLVFAIAALSIGATLVLSDYILPVISAIIPVSGLAALVGSLILFMPCAVCFGTIGPQIMYKASQDDDYSGKKTDSTKIVVGIGAGGDSRKYSIDNYIKCYFVKHSEKSKSTLLRSRCLCLYCYVNCICISGCKLD